MRVEFVARETSGESSLGRLPPSPLLDKTDNPDDPDPGRQVGAFLAANSEKKPPPPRLYLHRCMAGAPGQERTSCGCQKRIP